LKIQCYLAKNTNKPNSIDDAIVIQIAKLICMKDSFLFNDNLKFSNISAHLLFGLLAIDRKVKL
jgi:hypothetical protein